MSTSYGAVVDRRENWRLITSALSHTDPLHLSLNTASIFALASMVEEHYGYTKQARNI